jgi:hypothetical protein
MRNVDSKIRLPGFDCCVFLFYSLSAVTFSTASVRLGNTHKEKMFSGLLPKADIGRGGWQVRSGQERHRAPFRAGRQFAYPYLRAASGKSRRLANAGHRETSPPPICASGRGRCWAAGCLADCTGANLSGATGALDRWLCTFRWQRHHRTSAGRLGQAFVVDNRPGGGGNVATEAVVNATPDGFC